MLTDLPEGDGARGVGPGDVLALPLPDPEAGGRLHVVVVVEIEAGRLRCLPLFREGLAATEVDVTLDTDPDAWDGFRFCATDLEVVLPDAEDCTRWGTLDPHVFRALADERRGLNTDLSRGERLFHGLPDPRTAFRAALHRDLRDAAEALQRSRRPLDIAPPPGAPRALSPRWPTGNERSFASPPRRLPWGLVASLVLVVGLALWALAPSPHLRSPVPDATPAPAAAPPTDAPDVFACPSALLGRGPCDAERLCSGALLADPLSTPDPLAWRRFVLNNWAIDTIGVRSVVVREVSERGETHVVETVGGQNNGGGGGIGLASLHIVPRDVDASLAVRVVELPTGSEPVAGSVFLLLRFEPEAGTGYALVLNTATNGTELSTGALARLDGYHPTLNFSRSPTLTWLTETRPLPPATDGAGWRTARLSVAGDQLVATIDAQPWAAATDTRYVNGRVAFASASARAQWRDLVSVPVAGEERCNGLDDNCDGLVDEGLAGCVTRSLSAPGGADGFTCAVLSTTPEGGCADWCALRDPLMPVRRKLPDRADLGLVYLMDLCDSTAARIDTPPFRCAGGVTVHMLQATSDFEPELVLCPARPGAHESDCLPVHRLPGGQVDWTESRLELRPPPDAAFGPSEVCRLGAVARRTSCCNGEGEFGGRKALGFLEVTAEFEPPGPADE